MCTSMCKLRFSALIDCCLLMTSIFTAKPCAHSQDNEFYLHSVVDGDPASLGHVIKVL